MTPEQREQLRYAAWDYRTNPNPGTEAAFHRECKAEEIEALIAQVEALTVSQAPFTYTADGIVMSPLEYIDYMHRQYAGERLRADQGWERYESANRDRNALRASLVAPTIPAIPGTKEQS